MGDRSGRTTRRFDSADLVALTKKSIIEQEPIAQEPEDDPFADWDERQPDAIATGSQGAALPTTSRTATVHDPMTTGLLAEVARRTSTMEIDPRTIAAAAVRSTVDIDPEILEEVLREAQRTPVPELQPHTTKRRTK
jgi:hypothetical protein